ncbi:uncharacterized protein LOC136032454 [Artemia franciscana]|uniref:uncharacterized protein LOC136032454 n=1 Tax=Artemia franciscana TaxID=6661 RepID=UPI0032D9C2EF
MLIYKKMNAYDRIRLMKCTPCIKDSLMPKYVLSSMLAEDIIDEEDFRDVLSSKGREKQVQKLIEILSQKSSQAFRKFIKILDEDHDWLAETIKSIEVSDDEVESFFASRGNNPKRITSDSVQQQAYIDEARGIDVQDSVPMNRRPAAQQHVVERPQSQSKEITYEMLTVLRRNSRVVRNWCALAHRLGLSTQVNSIHMKINMRMESVDLAIIYLMEEWKGIQPKDYNLEQLVRILREEQFNDVAGRKDGVHRQGVGPMMNKEAAKSCLGCGGINNIIPIAHFMTKKFRVSIIVVYAPVELTDGDTSNLDEFYLQLQEQIDRVSGINLMYLLGDFNAHDGRNRGRWYPSPECLECTKDSGKILLLIEKILRDPLRLIS